MTYPYITHHKGVVACRIIILVIAGFCSKIKFFKKKKEIQLTLLTINEKRQCDEIDKSLNETNYL